MRSGSASIAIGRVEQVAKLTSVMIGQLADRGIDEELATKLDLGSLPSKRPGGGEALIIPFVSEGKIVNRKYRTLVGEKKFWQDPAPNNVQCFWNEDVLRDKTLIGEALIITEGEMDAFAAMMGGFVRVVSVPGGAPKEPLPEDTTKYKFIDRVRSLLTLDRVKEIILAVDNDAAGQNLLADLSVRLGRFRCKQLTYPLPPEGKTIKDLNDVLMCYGVEGVKQTIKRAKWLNVPGVYRLSELPPLPPDEIYELHMDAVDFRYKVRMGDFAVATGIPSHGKSTFVNDVCCRLAHNYGLRTTFASFEQSPQGDHKRNLRTWYLGKPTNNADEGEIRQADKWIDEHFSFMVPSEDDDVTLDWVLDKLEVAVIQYGSRIVVIDPWNELDHQRRRDESLTEYVGRAIKALKRFAKKMNVHLIIVAHPTKQRKNEDGTYQVPTLYDISDSANWYNKADIGFIVHRSGLLNGVLLRFAKSRYHDIIGVPGDVNADFHFASRRFINFVG